MIRVSRKTGAFLIIYAVNVHTGGGKVLLDELIENQTFGKISAAFLDERYPVISSAQFPIFTSRGTLINRFLAELKLHRYIQESKTQEPVLFFGNLPPLFRPRTKAFLYLQNCFLTRQVPLPRDNRKVMIRNWVESLLLKFFNHNVSEIWVQTNWMKKMTARFLPNTPVVVKAFLPKFKAARDPSIERIYDFLYVGSLSLHKRFSFFKEALRELDTKLTKKIKIAIALDQASQQIDHLHFKNIEINLNFQLNRDDLAKLYQQSKVFVITSKVESFGLPLYESHYFGCEILAPIAGYTEDLPFSIRHFQTESHSDLAKKMLDAL